MLTVLPWARRITASRLNHLGRSEAERRQWSSARPLVDGQTATGRTATPHRRRSPERTFGPADGAARPRHAGRRAGYHPVSEPARMMRCLQTARRRH